MRLALRQRKEEGEPQSRRLGLGSLGFLDALLQALLAAMAAAVQFLFAFNFLVGHGVLLRGKASGFPGDVWYCRAGPGRVRSP